MPTLEWIGKEKVINHHQDVPYRVLERQYSYTGNTLLVLRQRTFQKHTLSHNKIPLSYLARAALSTRAAR